MPPGGGQSNSKPPPKAPNPKRPQPKVPTGLLIWWPLDDGFHTTDSGGSASAVYKQSLITNRFTSASDFGQLSCPVAGANIYDHSMGGYVYNNNKPGGGHLQSSGNSEISFPNLGEGGVDDPNTISIWAYITSDSAQAYGSVIHKEFSAANVNISIRTVTASTKWELGYTSGGVAKSILASNVYALNRWNHLVAVHDTGTVIFYINGEIIGTSAGTPDANGNEWKIGSNNANDKQFNGYVWNCMMFQRALKGSEVKELFLNPFEVFTVLDPPIIVPEVPVVPPPPGTPGVPYTLLVGRPATPIPSGEQIISNNSGPKPIF